MYDVIISSELCVATAPTASVLQPLIHDKVEGNDETRPPHPMIPVSPLYLLPNQEEPIDPYDRDKQTEEEVDLYSLLVPRRKKSKTKRSQIVDIVKGSFTHASTTYRLR